MSFERLTIVSPLIFVSSRTIGLSGHVVIEEAGGVTFVRVTHPRLCVFPTPSNKAGVGVLLSDAFGVCIEHKEYDAALTIARATDDVREGDWTKRLIDRALGRGVVHGGAGFNKRYFGGRPGFLPELIEALRPVSPALFVEKLCKRAELETLKQLLALGVEPPQLMNCQSWGDEEILFWFGDHSDYYSRFKAVGKDPDLLLKERLKRNAELAQIRYEAISHRAFELCIGLASHDLPALVLLELVDMHGIDVVRLVPRHIKYDLVCAIKHFKR